MNRPPSSALRSKSSTSPRRRAEVSDFADRVAQRFSPQRIILFGSHASDTSSLESDVDILVVLDHHGHPALKAAEIRRAIPASFSLDLIVRSPSRIAERLKLGDPFFSEICSQGVVLYESADG